ncbi:MAG: histidinol-phosphate transaminase [Lachnospiraceae bacterium]|nr:histidinol-phosphate transaminase [Lachnospiraceae bacterium]
MVNRDNFRKIDPYVPGDQPDFADMVKLNTNENPYPPAPAVIEAAERFSAGRLKLYPPTDGGALRRDLAAYHGVAPENVFVGVGSDDVLSVIFQSCFNSGRKLFFPEISYSFYEVWAELYKIPYFKVPLKADFTIDADDYIGKENGGIVIANPNAPTSMAMPAADIERIVAANPENIVVIDEAYVDFGGESVLELTRKYDNLIVVRTFSKSRSMAGLRIGYAIAQPELISAINDVKNSINSYTMNFPSIEVGKASIAEEEYFRTVIARILKTRERLVSELSKLGFVTFPSSANFIFTTHKTVPAKEIFEKLREKHIFVRFFNKPLINNYLRITVGTDEEVDKLVAALKVILQK